MLVRGFPAQAFDTNCWVVAPAEGADCVVIDPGIGVEEQLDAVLREHDLKPVAVLLTHGHLDHTFSVTPVCGAKDVPAWIHPGDRELLRDPALGMGVGLTQLFGGRLQWQEPSDVALLDPATPLELAGMTLQVGFTPGHTPGSCVFEVAGESVVFSGDLLFAGSIGRTDLPGGSWEQMQQSLAETMARLPDDVVVHTGHGPSTTIGRERATNPFLQGLAVPPPSRGL